MLYVLATPVSECEVGSVEDGEQFFNQRRSGILENLVLLALDALAVIVELSLEAQQRIKVLVPLVGQLPLGVFATSASLGDRADLAFPRLGAGEGLLALPGRPDSTLGAGTPRPAGPGCLLGLWPVARGSPCLIAVVAR